MANYLSQEEDDYIESEFDHMHDSRIASIIPSTTSGTENNHSSIEIAIRTPLKIFLKQIDQLDKSNGKNK